MRARTASLAWSLWGVSVVALAAALTVEFLGGALDLGFFTLLTILVPLGYATVGALIASRHPGNAIGWLFTLIGVAIAVAFLTESYAALARQTPGSLPGATFATWLQSLAFIAALAPIPIVLLLFPNGRALSPRWRPVAWLQLGAVALGGVSEGLGPLASVLGIVAGIVALTAALLSVGALVLRFRRSRGEERQQLRWLAYAAGGAALLLVGLILSDLASEIGLLPSGVNDAIFTSFVVVVGVGIPAASGIAILKYRLYDLDLVVRKTVVFGLLAAVITAVYLGVVIGIPTLLVGAGGRVGLPLQLAATLLVALVFQPLRDRARRVANRIVYGRRATPYEVLSEFAERVAGAYSTEDVLPRMAHIAAEGTGAARAEVWLRVGSELRREAAWPESAGEAPTASLDASGLGEARSREEPALPTLPGADVAIPVVHQGELLGALAVAAPPADPMTPAREALLRDLASQAGLVLRNVRLTAELRARLEDLRASRQRLVKAQDEERRRLERNIHDGAQQQLVSIGVKLGLARAFVRPDPDRADVVLEQLQAESREALETLRDLARGIYPPLLADAGLVAALEAQARKSAVPASVEADGIGRYPQEVEAAVYFCTLEALQNAGKYANASNVVVRLRGGRSELSFEVADDGVGFDPERGPRGSGLHNMVDRLEALGGRLQIRSAPGAGTTVSGRLPVPSLEPVR